MPEAEVVQLDPRPAEPVTSTDWWQRIGDLKRRQAGALAERAELTAKLGGLTLAAAGQDSEAEAELARVRARLAELANVEQETAAAIAVAEARQGAAASVEAIARRQDYRAQCRELGARRKQFAAGIDTMLAELETVLRGFRVAGRLEMQALRSGGASVEMGGISDSSDAVGVCDAVQRVAPTLAQMLSERGFSLGLSISDARPLAAHEVYRQANVERALEQAAYCDLGTLEEAA